MSASQHRKQLLAELLGPLHMRFGAAKAAYRAYLDQGRTFLFAQSLRRINLSSRELLLDKGWLLPSELQAHALALVAHYDAWLTLWDDLARRVAPGPSVPFVFENSFTYPREAEQALERLYAELAAAA